jgi:hypothetical protein
MNSQTLYGDLVFAQNAIANALEHETVKTALANLGYDSNRMQEGLALYKKAAHLYDRQMKEYGEQFAATQALITARIEANKLYKLHLNVARIALRDDRNAAVSLQFNGKRKRTFSGWLEQARLFYANALASEKIVQAMSQYNITREKLEEGNAAVEKVEKLFNEQMQEIGDAQASTKERDRAFDALQAWMNNYTSIARLALDGQSQYLEVLGIVEPS